MKNSASPARFTSTAAGAYSASSFSSTRSPKPASQGVFTRPPVSRDERVAALSLITGNSLDHGRRAAR